ncbi:type II toxin-antitoxin system MqsR family toxin [Variovorax sp. J31P216]|nr:type II toxin-antitoxin system MqsR family toxin [Variovorax sp. J31P216]
MEKSKPRWSLSVVRALAVEGRWAVSHSALAGAARLGLDAAGLLRLVMALGSADFHRSMNRAADRRSWQDVYRTAGATGCVELKLSAQAELLIASCQACRP